MKWEVYFIDEAQKDMRKLDGSARAQVYKAMEKVSQNPVSKQEGGYGTPLGNKRDVNLTGFMKVKLKSLGIRIVYRVEEDDGIMRVIIVGIRDDEEVYRMAASRIERLP